MPRLGRQLLFLLGALLLLIAQAWPAAAEKRVALVIGNSTYKSATALTNPRNDAEDLATALRDLGFEVMMRVNLVKDERNTVLKDFARMAAGADTAMVYYAGHALQYQDRLYMVPIDAALEDELSVKYDMLAIDDIRDMLAQVKGTRIMVFDACRNDPFAGKPGSGGAATPQITPLPQSVTVYATAPFEVAEDGKSRNSPFTRALLKHIGEPGLDVRKLFRQVTRDVAITTAGRQVPDIAITLKDGFVFSKGDTDATMWGRIRFSKDAADFRDFMTRYPNSEFGADARFRLDMLGRQVRLIEEARRRDEDARKREEEQKRKDEEERRAAEERKRAAEQLAQVCQQESILIGGYVVTARKAELQALKAAAKCPDSVPRIEIALREIASAEADAQRQAFLEACSREATSIEEMTEAGRKGDLQSLRGTSKCPETAARVDAGLRLIAARELEAQQRLAAETCSREATQIEELVAAGKRNDLLALKANAKCPDTAAKAEAGAKLVLARELEAAQKAFAEACKREATSIEEMIVAGRKGDLQALRGSSKCPDATARVDVGLRQIAAREQEAQQKAFAEGCAREVTTIAEAAAAGRKADLQGLRGASKCPETAGRVDMALKEIAARESEAQRKAQAELCAQELKSVNDAAEGGRKADLIALKGKAQCSEAAARAVAALDDIAAKEQAAKKLAAEQAAAEACRKELETIDQLVANDNKSALASFKPTVGCGDGAARIFKALAAIDAREKQAQAQLCAQEGGTVAELQAQARREDLDGLRRSAKCKATAGLIDQALAALKAQDDKQCAAETSRLGGLGRSDEAALSAFVEAARCAKAKDRGNEMLAEARQARQLCEREEAEADQLKASGSRDERARFLRNAKCEPAKRIVLASLEQPPLGGVPGAGDDAAARTALIERGQNALSKVGCYDGATDGKAGARTSEALRRYLERKGEAAEEPDFNEEIVRAIEAEGTRRICPIECDADETLRDGRCVAKRPVEPTRPAKPDKPEKRIVKPAEPKPPKVVVVRPQPPTPQQVAPAAAATKPKGPRLILGN